MNEKFCMHCKTFFKEWQLNKNSNRRTKNILRYEINKRKTPVSHQVGTLGKLSGADDYDLVGHADLLGQ